MMRYRQHNPLVVTLPEIYPNEARALFALIECGAEIIHIRKPGAAESTLREYLATIHPETLYHITLHYHPALAGYFGLGGVHERLEALEKTGAAFRKSVSCHDWGAVKACTGRADYVFLSPVFDSVSKAGYRAAFGGEELRILLQDADRPPVVALGGITPQTVRQARHWGFEGAAAIGSIWALRGGQIDIARTTANYKQLASAWNSTK
jgi:thiamine-phosphate pyrophosphorylase